MVLKLAALLAFGSAAQAEAIVSLPLPLGPQDSVLSATYRCAGGAPFRVQYVNSGENRLAILPIDGTERIFVNVISGSGARYAAGQYIWWTKGATATLGNDMSDAKPQDCISQDYPG